MSERVKLVLFVKLSAGGGRQRRTPRAGRNTQNRGSLGDMGSNYGSRSHNGARADVEVLQNLCPSTDQHTLPDYHAPRDVRSRIDHGGAAYASFVSQRAAEVTECKRFQDDVHGGHHTCSDKASFAEGGRLNIDDSRRVNEPWPRDSIHQGIEFPSQTQAN